MRVFISYRPVVFVSTEHVGERYEAAAQAEK